MQLLKSLCVLGLSLAAHAASLTLKSPRIVVADSLGNQLRAEPFSLTQKAAPVKLDPRDILKLTFQIVDEDGKGVQPHQTFIRFYDAATGEEGVQPVKVSPAGKAKFEVNLQKPPQYLPPTTASSSLSVTLLIGQPNTTPIKAELFDLTLPASQPAPAHPDEKSFKAQEELFHTFRPEQKLPPKFVSLVFAAIALAPWGVLVGLWSKVAPAPTNLLSSSILPFVLSLGALELLLFWYWVKLKLGDVLLYGFILSIPTVLTGKRALSSISSSRLSGKQ